MSMEIITGGMFAGKTEALIKRVNRAKFQGKKIQLFKHARDTRDNRVKSHDNKVLHAVSVTSSKELESFVETDSDVIAVDEAQFFTDDYFLSVILKLSYKYKVIIAGLDLDYQGLPFPSIQLLFPFADDITKLHAVCKRCGKDACRSQRIIDGRAVTSDDAPLFDVGAGEKYEARCLDCFES